MKTVFLTKNPDFYDYEDWTAGNILLQGPEGFDPMVEFLKGLDMIDFDTETNTLHPFKGGVLLTILGNKDLVYVIDTTLENGYSLREIFEPLDLPIRKLRGANLKFDLKFLIHAGLPLPLGIWDVMVAEQTLTKGTNLSCSLDEIVQRRLVEVPLQKAVRKEFPLMSNKVSYFYLRHINYSAEDVVYLEEIMLNQQGWLTKLKQQELAAINMVTTMVVAEAEVYGIKLDREAWLENAKKYEKMLIDAEREMDNILIANGIPMKPRNTDISVQLDLMGMNKFTKNENKQHINYNSNNQLTAVFEKLGWEIPIEPNTGRPSYAKDVLAEYVIEHHGTPAGEFVRKLRDYNVAKKRTSSFGDAFLAHIKSDGAIHPEFSVNRTETGRFSCSNPNMQQIPNTLDFRHCFVARDGYKILSADYSSAELRILADFSGDEKMAEILEQDKDLHGYVATTVFRKLLDDPELVVDKNNNKELRNKIKAVIFSKVYGAGVKKTAELLDCSLEEAQIAETAMREALPQAFAFLDKVGDLALLHGKVVFNDVMNQVRYFPECWITYKDGTRARNELAEGPAGSVMRRAMNAPIQGTNGEMIKQALADYHYIRLWEDWGDDVRFLLQVHDELVFEVKAGDKEEYYKKRIVEIMTNAANKFLKISKMKTEAELAPYWTK